MCNRAQQAAQLPMRVVRHIKGWQALVQSARAWSWCAASSATTIAGGAVFSAASRCDVTAGMEAKRHAIPALTTNKRFRELYYSPGLSFDSLSFPITGEVTLEVDC